MTQAVRIRRLVGTAVALGAVLSFMSVMSAGAQAAAVKNSVGTVPIKLLGTVDLSSYSFSGTHSNPQAFRQGASLASATPSGTGRDADPAIARLRQNVGPAEAALTLPVTSTNPAGESGFTALTGYDQAAANGNVDLEPPDQGLCAGNGDVADFINNAFAVYDAHGDQLLNTVPSYALFLQPSTAFLSDPRCYYDSATQRWFLTEFVVGNTSGTVPSVQFIAVSNTSDVMGSYSVYGINTTDKSSPNCPCFGDFDQLGADDNGIYIATNEFGDAVGFNGAVIYAISKQTLEQFANTGIAPFVFRYRLKSDYFGQPYHVSPSSSPPGATFAPNTEYFVESNSDAVGGDHLAVYGLNDTSDLASPAPTPPKLRSTLIASEPYSFPPDATQKAGPIPLGNANQDPEGQLQADFNAIQEVTYVGGQLYAEASTNAGGRDGVDWFEIAPTDNGSTVTATMTNQGRVKVAGQNIIYPAIALNKAGNGDMAFTLSGPKYYPSAAYTAFTPSGPGSSVIVAGAGAAPEDGFTCYSAFVGPDYGGCRWGDYSMGVAMGPNIFLATEYIPPTSRDYLTNWGTFVWHAPAP